jgi:hypothetical protein
MSGQVRLVRRTHGTIGHDRCVLCGQPCESVQSGWVLGQAGEVCLWCVQAGPRDAAQLLHRRAAKARWLAERCRPCLLSWGWTGLHRLLHEHAAALDRLAGVLETLSAW